MKLAFDIQSEIDALIQGVDESQKVSGGPSGYRLRRIILANFWLYGLQVFEIPHGRLVLAGNNASGKSTVLTAALPLALEGSLRPERLDTFGGKHKHAEYYVLGDEASSFSCKKRTTYIALEFEWCPTDEETAQVPDIEVFSSPQQEPQDKARYLTIGVSLYGNESAAIRIQPMYFLITDGSRLINNIKLTYVDHDKQTHTYSQHDFKESLKGHGIICDTQEKYAREVSKRLFGFDDPGSFRKLIELLLVLRCPNPSDKLTLSTVQQHLTDALPNIPSDIAKEAVETIGEIDNLQQQIGQIEQEYQAVSELHHAQQQLVLSKARNAGFSYKVSHQIVERLNTQIAALHRDLADLEVQYQRDNDAYEEMRAEKERTAGRITAIEMGEGIKAAQQVVEVQSQVKSTREQVDKQQKNLDRAQRRLQSHEDSLLSQSKQFQSQLENCERQMQNLHVLINEKAFWYEVAEQFEQGLDDLGHITAMGIDVVDVIQRVSRLTAVDTEQRVKWLQKLDQLHQEKKSLELAIERAQADEGRMSREADRWFVQFRAELGNFSALSQQIELRLESIITSADNTVTDIVRPEDSHTNLDVASLEGKTSFEDIDDLDSYVERCAEQLRQHKESIEAIMRLRRQTLQKWKKEIESLNIDKGSQSQTIRMKEQEYKAKKNQPEALPKQPEHRIRARNKLKEQNIPAFPLYSLVDLVPESQSEEAGYIEQMLEDTGLLNALVILDEDIPMADNLLQAEGLSDYRLDIVKLEQILVNNTIDSSKISVGRWLQFDPAVRDALPATYQQWEATINKFIPLVEALLTLPTPLTSSNTDTTPMPSIANPYGKWQHGLLAGQSAKGKVRFIGKTARQRTRQQELANLEQEIATLKSKFEELIQHLAERMAQFDKFSAEQDEIHTLVEKTGLSVSHQGLKNISVALSNAQRNYKDAQEQTRNKRHQYSQLTKKLVEQSGSTVAFGQAHEKVQQALRETYKLGTQIGLLQQGLQALITLHEAMQENQRNLQESRIDQEHNQAIYITLQDQLVRYESTLEGLQEIANSLGVKDLTLQLESLRMRARQLGDNILATAKKLSTFTERTKSLSETVLHKEDELQTAQVDMRHKQTLFKDLLITYPVPELQNARLLVDEGEYVKAVQPLLINVSTLERLQKEQLDAHSTLNTTHQAYMSLLHEYGPDLDKQTSLITFSQANGLTPSGLLNSLDENRKTLQELLKMEEIKLFESFLLRRMTEVLHKYIREAKEWVNKMNEPLQTMATVQDRYELEWQPKPRLEEAKLGSHLAKHQKLFNKPLPKLTEEERELLKVAFKQEINAIWHNQNESSGMNFEQRLQAIFDYRQWFQFSVYVTPAGGQRTLLTNKVIGKRSGAERLFALLVPLLAAVTALYNRASEGAPRLLALDEAFDRASFDNTKQFIEYLAGQDFQWIMTGPQLNLSGTQIPVSIRYLMLHEKGTQIATAAPKIWRSHQTS